jgi:hypothetical protein
MAFNRQPRDTQRAVQNIILFMHLSLKKLGSQECGAAVIEYGRFSSLACWGAEVLQIVGDLLQRGADFNASAFIVHLKQEALSAVNMRCMKEKVTTKGKLHK